MAEMGDGYGSECHLLRFMGRHRTHLDERVCTITGADAIDWLDAPFEPERKWPDGEWKALNFLPKSDPARGAWRTWWPSRGNPPNWDAVARIQIRGATEWLLVEAKANEEELASSCQAQAHGGRPQIEQALTHVKQSLGVGGISWPCQPHEAAAVQIGLPEAPTPKGPQQPPGLAGPLTPRPKPKAAFREAVLDSSQLNELVEGMGDVLPAAGNLTQRFRVAVEFAEGDVTTPDVAAKLGAALDKLGVA